MEGRVDTFLNVTDPASLEERALSRQMPLTGLIGLRFDEPDKRWWIEGTLQLADNANILSPGDKNDTERIPPGGHESYAVASLRAGIRVCKDVTVTMACENITNEEYRVHGSGINQPGRNFILGVEFRF
jgi:hemoglobin/transferrin/lactoferrin receptor protein